MVYLGWSAQQLEKIGVPVNLSYAYASNTAELFGDLNIHNKYKHSWNKYKTLTDLRPVYESFMEKVEQFTREITAAVEKA